MACMGHSCHWAPDYYAPVPSLSRDSGRRGMTSSALISAVDKAVQRDLPPPHPPPLKVRKHRPP